ncbi:hypothetical protein CAL14_19680 [Bordetella genomosp. 9]|nr:hypothetical protein CAL14_19680 [Bordetella genomosp. 9]
MLRRKSEQVMNYGTYVRGCVAQVRYRLQHILHRHNAKPPTVERRHQHGRGHITVVTKQWQRSVWAQMQIGYAIFGSPVLFIPYAILHPTRHRNIVIVAQ